MDEKIFVLKSRRGTFGQVNLVQPQYEHRYGRLPFENKTSFILATQG